MEGKRIGPGSQAARAVLSIISGPQRHRSATSSPHIPDLRSCPHKLPWTSGGFGTAVMRGPRQAGLITLIAQGFSLKNYAFLHGEERWEAPSQVMGPKGQDNMSKPSNSLGELGDGEKAGPPPPGPRPPPPSYSRVGFLGLQLRPGTRGCKDNLVTKPSSVDRDSESH